MDYFYVLGGIEVSVEDRKGFINCLIERDEERMGEIGIDWDELCDDEILDEFNIPDDMREDIGPLQLVAFLKAQTRAGLAEASFNPECR